MKKWGLLILTAYIVSHAAATSELECGRSFTSGHRQPRNFSYNQGRIINGKKTLRGAWPWQVSLQLLHPKFGLIGHWCGAVLIQPLWILTAAHCVNNEHFNLPIAALWTAVLGEWDREVPENTEIHVPIDRIIMHERFHNYQNDIAMMKLSKPVDFPPVCLPTEMTSYNLYPEISKTLDPTPLVYEAGLMGRNPGTKRRPKKLAAVVHEMFSNSLGSRKQETKSHRKPTQCIATGWGRYDAAGSDTATLLQARVPLLDNTKCQEKYGGTIPIRMGHLCAGKLDGTTGTCVGDSGGPLQCSLQDGRWVLAGITSFGSGCARPGYPDVFTRLAFYVPWIQMKLKAFLEQEKVEQEDNYVD